ncbi:MAG: type II secretion system protein GspN [Spirochaetes bacterium]|jgi:type II secretion system protein N|nr:type II secretion system protein GspN [Spirochaetota bacterium]
MELKISKDSIKKILNDVIVFIKDVRTLPNFWMYITLSVVLSILFFIATFPYEMLLRNKLNDIGGNFGRSFSVGTIDFNLIGASTINNLSLSLDNGSEFDFENISLNAGIFSALFGKTIEGSLEIPNFKYNKDKASLNAILNAEFKLDFNSYSEFPSGGFITLKLQNAQLNGMTIKDFNIPPIRFTLVDADIKIIKRSLSIKNLQLSGPDLNGSIKGDLTFAKVASGSRMNLSLEIDSKSALLENYKILLGDSMSGDNKLIINLRGTISNPQINFSQGSQGMPSSAAVVPDRERDNPREMRKTPGGPFNIKEEEPFE